MITLKNNFTLALGLFFSFNLILTFPSLSQITEATYDRASYFLTNSVEEYTHSRKLQNYLTMRGGRTQLSIAIEPKSEYNHEEKGDALFGLEVSVHV